MATSKYPSPLYLHFLVSFFTTSLFAQSKVDFTADIQTGCAPLFVKFTNLSQPTEGTTFYWDFGNGNISQAVNPQTSFLTPGEFSIKLVMTKGAVKDSVVLNNYIKVMDKPTPSFYLNGDTLRCAPFSAQFINQSSDKNGAALNFLWSFGDGSVSTEPNPDKVYTAGGDYDVTLLATNQYGCSQAVTIEKLVHALKPIPKFGADKTYSCNGSLHININNLTASPIGYTSSWSFGNGDTSNENSPSYLFDKVGNYTIGLTVTDTLGCTGFAQAIDLVRIVKTEAIFTTSADTICPGQSITFINTSKNANSSIWIFGDGTTSTASSPTKVFNTPGDFQVTLVGSNGTCIDTAKASVNVELVKADFIADDPFICQIPKTITYQNLSTNAVAYNWTLGNKTTSKLENPTAEYTINNLPPEQLKATFTDILTVTSKHGCTDKAQKTNYVTIHIPNVLVDPGSGGNAKTLNGCIPMSLRFRDVSDYSSPYDSIVAQKWTLPNGSQLSGNELLHEVTEVGNYPIKLTVTTAKGCVHSKSETIKAGVKVSPNFNVVGNSVVCATTPVDFVITQPAQSSITNHSWVFGDEDPNDAGGLPVIPHYYTKTGPMDVTLKVYNYGCMSSITKPKAVTILGPITTVTRVLDCNKPYDHQFVAEISEATSFKWDFGDGSPIDSVHTKPTHTYANKGEYIVSLSAKNAQSGCTFPNSIGTNVFDVESKIAPFNNKICANTEIDLDGTTSVDAVAFERKNEISKYLWLLGDAGNDVFTNDPIAKSFSNNGPVEIKLVTSDANGCTDTASVNLKVFKPKTDFLGNYKLGCMPVTFEFNDLSKSDTTITSWLWTFGDNTTSSLQHPIHEYTQFGKYSVSLNVTDALGCSNSLNKNQMVTAVFPKPSFFATDTALCKGDTTRFIDNSDGFIVEYKWDLGNNNFSSLASPTLAFPDAGIVDITLNITDDHGCKASVTRSNYIQVQGPPVSDFTVDGNSSSCYPFLVQFTDKSASPHLKSWKWSFGENSNVSSLQNPFFMYNKPGNHDVSLISYTSNGCSDTIVKKGIIHIEGPYANIGVADTLCKNTETRFVAINKMNVFDMQWDFGDGFTASGDSVWHQYNFAGNITPLLFLRTDNLNSCNKVIVDTLNVLDLKAAFDFKDNIDQGCPPLNTGFANTSLNADNWLWDFGNGTTSVLQDPWETYEISGVYNVKLIANHHLGCADTSSYKAVTVFPLPQIHISPDTLICVDSPALLHASGGQSYRWYPADKLSAPLQHETTANPIVNTRFGVVVTDQNLCVDSAFTNIIVQQIPVVTLADTTIIIGESFSYNLTDDAIAKYSWIPAVGLSCTDCPSPLIAPLINTNYELAVTDTSNCFTLSYPINVTVLQKFSVDLPDAFTPNGDLINDVVLVKGWGIKELISLKIFNRFGQLVFQSSNLQQGWDGTFKGAPQPTETYQYSVEVRTFTDKVLAKTGSIILVR